jgi:N-acetylglutamate synthase-like GNAT family acetyltransferase
MKIRRAHQADAAKISYLLAQLDYPTTEEFVQNKIVILNEHADEELVVCEDKEHVVAVLSIHFIPQLALRGPFARISYLCVDDSLRHMGIGQKMEEYCVRIARERGCDRIEVHCHYRRVKAHEFYSRQGYTELPKYIVKNLD